MFWFKKNSKGFVTIYTLLILSLIFSLLFFTLKLELMKNRYNRTWVNMIIKENENEEARAYLLSKLINYVNINCTMEPIEENILQEVLRNMGKIYYKSSYLEYSEKDKKIMLTLVNLENSKIIEKYEYVIQDNRIKFEM